VIRTHIADRFGDELNTIIEELLVCAESSEAGRNVYLCGAAKARGSQEVLAA
jgi:hypothetical protein